MADITARLTVTIPPEHWLTSNRPITRHAHRARIIRDIHTRTALAARSQSLTPAVGPVRAYWTIRYPKGTGWKHGDSSNAHPTCKAILDALVEGGWLPGDGPREVTHQTYTRGPNLDYPALHDVDLFLGWRLPDIEEVTTS